MRWYGNRVRGGLRGAEKREEEKKGVKPAKTILKKAPFQYLKLVLKTHLRLGSGGTCI